MTRDWSDEILESLLSESLGERRPPDLTARILERRKLECEGVVAPGSLIGGITVEPVAQIDAIEAATISSLTRRVTLKSESDSARKHSDGSNTAAHYSSNAPLSPAEQLSIGPLTDRVSARAAWASLAALAAGLLICVAVVRNWHAPNAGNIAKGDARKQSQLADKTAVALPGNTTENSSAKPSKAGGAPSLATDAKQPGGKRSAQEIALDDLPFAVGPGPDVFASDDRSSIPLVTKLDDVEITGLINSRLADLWRTVGVEPAPAVSEKEAKLRTVEVLLGSSEVRNLDSIAPEKLLPQVVRSGRFAEHVAGKIVDRLLRGTASAKPDHSDAQKLKALISDQIVRRVPWNRILAGLVGSEPDQPAAGFMNSIAGGDNHRLVERIGDVLLDENLRCARCHDASDNGRVITFDQNDYWSLIALFRGIESQTDEATHVRRVVDKQSTLLSTGKFPAVFFERPDGRLQAAQLRLPHGAEWRSVASAPTPRKALSQWIASSDLTDKAAVNTAWRIVYGRPLVAQHSALSDVGTEERRALLDSLAQQFAAHNRDLAQLVGWVASADAFRASELVVDRQKWLLAEESTIDKWRSAGDVFAAYRPSTPSAELRSLDKALAAAVRWNDSHSDRRTQLAQPNPEAGAAKKDVKREIPSGEAAAPVEYLVLSHKLTESQQSWLKRLAGSKLTWEQQIIHIAGMVGDGDMGPSLKPTADKLLESVGGNKQQALEQLLFTAILTDLSR